MIARVLPDLPAVDRIFDYLVPDDVRDQVRVGTIVRVPLAGRRVRGWVVGVAGEPAPGVEPKPLLGVSSGGPPAPVVDLARWAAHRWAGRWAHLLRAASPPANVPVVAPQPSLGGADRAGGERGGATVVHRVPPSADRLALVQAAMDAGPAIVVVPSVDAAVRLATRLRAEGRSVALLAGDVRAGEWDACRRSGTAVVGTRVAVWAPVDEGALAGIVVLDEHDEALQSESSPTWHAREVAIERARRAGVPCTLVSPVPTLHALVAATEVVAPGRAAERAGWPVVEVADRREEDVVKAGPFSAALARHLRSTRRVVCVVNRLGRSRLLACVACGEVAACAVCGAAVGQPAEAEVLRCASCRAERPVVCASCGRGRFKNLRRGVTRIREELEALVGEPVDEVTAADGEPGTARVAVGTEAVLHRLRAGSADVVAFLDFDQELLAPRYRAGEQAMVLLARAARAVGDRAGGGRIVVQTRVPDHPVLRAAVLGDPERFVDGERERREALRYPPAAALAVVSGPAAPAWAEAAGTAGAAGLLPPGVEVLGPVDGAWMVRAPGWGPLADFLGSVDRPAGRLRIEVDPPRT